nr:unnamed protein product [Spirometra erinaceieuropaei]
MGSPVSGLVAELFLPELEKIAFIQHEPMFWRRYVDDTFVIVKKDMLQHFHSLLNAVFPDIKFTSESPFTPPDYDFDEGPKIESVSFDEATVRKELMTINESKSPGPDDIPPKLLKELAAELAKPLSMLFQASFEAGCLPADWKSARITPLHKGGSKASANNYRPINLTSICCKLMEKIIMRELMRFLEQHNLLSDAQHGFRSGRSCVTNFLNCLERWARSVDEGNVLHVVYIDFKKAFDSVPHQRLLHKLSRTDVRGQTGRMLGSRIQEQKLAVRRGDALSQVAAHNFEMGHEFNFAATKIVPHAGNKTGREFTEARASDENPVNRSIDLAPANRAQRSHIQSCVVGR